MTRVKPFLCQHCGYMANAVGTFDASEAGPQEGDLALCIDCAQPNILHGDTWCKLTGQEQAALDPEEKAALERGTLAILQLHSTAGRPSGGKRGGRA